MLTLSESVVVQENDLLAVKTDGENPIPYDVLSKESGCEVFEFARLQSTVKVNHYITSLYFFRVNVMFAPCYTFSIRLLLRDNGN